MVKKLHFILLAMLGMMLSVGTKAYADYATVQAPYEVDFIASQDQFVIEDVLNDLGMPIWTQGNYGMTATTFVQMAGEEKKANHEGESWLVSPIINLAGISTPTLAITDQVNKYFGTIEEELEVCVREAGGQWKSLNIPYDKPSSTWGGWVDRVFDLAAYAGKKIQVGFHYIGHATTAGTYEVKYFSISSDAPVAKEEAGLSFETGNYTITLGEAYTLPVLSNPNNLPVTYTSSNVNVATVDEQGTVTPLAAGQTTIKATAEETDRFKAGSASYLLVVKEKGQAGTDAYQLVTDASTLSAGDQIIIVNEEMTYALSTTQNTNNRAATDVVESNYSITPSNLVQTITLEGSAGQWYFNVGNAYLYAASKSGNQLKTEDNPDEKAMASITIDGGIATVLFNQWDEGARTLMRFNPNNGNPIFSCYAPDKTTGTALRIFKKDGGTVIPPDPGKKECNSIADFKAMEKGNEAILKLNNAQVLGVAGKDVYVRDASGAIDFFNLGLTFETGQTLNGQIEGKYDLYNNLPELTKTDATNADGYTASAGTAEARSITIAQAQGNTYYCDLVKIDGVKIVSKEEGTFTNIYAYIGNDSVMIYAKKFNVEMGDYNENDTYTVEGILIPFKGKPEIYLTKSLAGGDTPGPSMTVCNSIAEFKALEKNKEAELKLNNAVVLYATEKDVFVRDASGAIDFYNTGITFTTGQILNGSIIGKLSIYNNLPELAKSDNTNADKISFTEGGAPVPVDISISQAKADTYLCDLIRLSQVSIFEEEGKTYASKDGETIQLFDKFKIFEQSPVEENTSYSVTGILVIYKENYQIYPTFVQTSSGINETTVPVFNPNAPAYNTAGQKVSPNYKGIVIQSGKKFVK